jgi:hypothetical protein
LPVHDRRQVDANDVDPTVTRHPVRSARLTS